MGANEGSSVCRADEKLSPGGRQGNFPSSEVIKSPPVNHSIERYVIDLHLCT